MIRQLLLSESDLRADDASQAPPGTLALLAEEFPTLTVRPFAPGGALRVLELDAREWRSPGFDPLQWDERVFGAAAESRGDLALHLTGARREALATTALELLTRYQGLVGRRNALSEGAPFDALVARHRALHDLSKPLVLGDYRHSLDTWQWVLRLAPGAERALQLAALFHDVERLLSEADARVEHLTRDYQDFKNAHAARSAELAHTLLTDLGEDAATRERVRGLIGQHEEPGGDECLRLLQDADALSFFSLEASGFTRAFPPEHVRRKVAHTLARLRPSRRWRLSRMRLSPRVRRLLDEALGAEDSLGSAQESA